MTSASNETPGGDSVRQRIEQQATDLTPAERQLAGTLLRDYPIIGLQSITKLADSAGVSTPTVIRLARKLGFEGFPELQAALRDEASAQIRQPAKSAQPEPVAAHLPASLGRFSEAVFSNMALTLKGLTSETFEAVAQSLADDNHKIALLGGRITRANADNFFNHLQIIRPGVSLLSQSPNVWPQYLLDTGPETVLVVFDIRRYEPALLKFAELSKEREAKVVLFTDHWGSPIHKFADHVIRAAIDVPSSWDSTLGINLVVEALIAEIQARRSEDARARIDELERVLKTTRLFRKTQK